MPSPWEILHNRTFQCPSKPLTPVNMECICNYLVSKCHSQKQSFNRAHGIRQLQELQPSQEVLLLSPAADQYIPGTIINKATVLHSYFVEAQGKRYSRTREHIRPIHLNIPLCKASHQQQPKPHIHTSEPSCIPKLQPHLNLVCHSKMYLPKPSLHPPSHIPISQSKPKPALANNSSPAVNQLLCHLSTFNSPAPAPSLPLQLMLPSDTQPVTPTPGTPGDQHSEPSHQQHTVITTNQPCQQSL